MRPAPLLVLLATALIAATLALLVCRCVARVPLESRLRYTKYGLPEGGYTQYGLPEGGYTQYCLPEGGYTQYGLPEGGYTQYGLPEGGYTKYGGAKLRYMTAAETAAFLLADADGYIAGLSPADLHARASASASRADYATASAASALTPTPVQRARLDGLISRAHSHVPFLHNVPWTLALTRDDVYENGLPHTRAPDVIFLSTHLLENTDDAALLRILIHERVHIWQRLAPDAAHAWLAARGYHPTAPRPPSQNPLTRANPDVSPFLWLGPDGRTPRPVRYRSAQPRSITDTDPATPSRTEDPYEWMAYSLAETLGGGHKADAAGSA